MRAFLVATLVLATSVVTPVLSTPLGVRGTDVAPRDSDSPPVARSLCDAPVQSLFVEVCHEVQKHDGH